MDFLIVSFQKHIVGSLSCTHTTLLKEQECQGMDRQASSVAPQSFARFSFWFNGLQPNSVLASSSFLFTSSKARSY